MKLVVWILLFLMSLGSVVNAKERHEMKTWGLTIESNEYRKGRKVECIKSKKRNYIKGDENAYRQNGIPLERYEAPYVEFPIETKLPGGEFYITVVYRITGDFAELRKQILYLEMDNMGAKQVELKRVRGLILRHTSEFKVNTWKGNKHMVKLWLPTEGVEVDKLEIRRKLNTTR